MKILILFLMIFASCSQVSKEIQKIDSQEENKNFENEYVCNPGASEEMNCAEEISGAESAYKTRTCNQTGDGFTFTSCLLGNCRDGYETVQGKCMAKAWQALLETHFDIVSTFDNIEDWQGLTGYHYDMETMPKTVDGKSSIWNYYTNDTPSVDDWIKDHGNDYRLGPDGKSLCINYNNFVGGIDGYGPSRLGTTFSNGNPQNGYKKMYLFFMIKFRNDFFVQKSKTTFNWVGVLKLVDFLSGFKEPGVWGTDAERNLVCNDVFSFHEYGLQGNIINVYGGGDSTPNNLFFITTAWNAYFDKERNCWGSKKYFDGLFLTSNASPANIEELYFKNSWIGIEYMIDIGTVNSSNASMGVKIYDENGVQAGGFSVSGFQFLNYFDHKLNRVTIGGNRFGAGYEKDPGDSDENRFYLDDFIIDDKPIADTYFDLLKKERN